jgi:hypothetical protein
VESWQREFSDGHTPSARENTINVPFRFRSVRSPRQTLLNRQRGVAWPGSGAPVIELREAALVPNRTGGRNFARLTMGRDVLGAAMVGRCSTTLFISRSTTVRFFEAWVGPRSLLRSSEDIRIGLSEQFTAFHDKTLAKARSSTHHCVLSKIFDRRCPN